MAKEEGFNINAFRSQIREQGIKKNTKFLVRFWLPIGLQNYNVMGMNSVPNSTQRYLEYWTESAQIPGMLLGAHEHRRYGYGSIEKVPIVGNFTEIPFTILCDSNNNNWKFFHIWSKLIYEHDGQELVNKSRSNFNGKSKRLYELSYKEDYVSTVEIKSFDDTGYKYLHVSLRDAFPIGLTEIDLNWNDVNTIQKFKIIISYTDYYIN